MDSDAQKRSKRRELAKFYGMPRNESYPTGTLDLNSKNFNADAYLNKSIKEKNLKQLLDEESQLVNDIQRLDSECQTLVYDHYDKFIAATDIVRQMKEGSTEMSEQIGKLQENMAKITESSKSITSDLQSRRDNLSHYLAIDLTLKKLQFLFMLPAKINECIKEQKYAEGVRCYQETAEVLQKYSHLPSFISINSDCKDALEKLEAALKEQLSLNEGSTQQLTLCVDLLLQLGEPANTLCENFLSQARLKLEDDLNKLENLAARIDNEEKCENLDILQFIDVCHDTFIANLWLVISSYKEMFIRDNDKLSSNKAFDLLCSFVCSLVEEYVAVVNVRVSGEELNQADFSALATALDKFHRRLHAISQLLPHVDFSEMSLNTTLEVAKQRCEASFLYLCDCFCSSVADVRHSLALPKTVTQERSTVMELNELLTKLVATTAANIKETVNAVLVFNQPKYTFAMNSDFRLKFCREFVRENLVVKFFRFITEELNSYCDKKNKDPALLLLLSRMCLDLHTSSVHYLLNHCDEQLLIEDKTGLTSLQYLTSEMMVTGQNLLNRYVTSQGSSVSQLLRRSIELKDWLGCSEPRSVRKVMRTVKEEIATMDVQVGALFEEGTRKDRSSDSSRRTMHSLSTSRHCPGRGNAWTGYSSNLDDSLVANLTKLWSEKIEIFAPVEFTRTSILTGIVKISLKTLLESIRLRTLSRFGFQQVQIDVHYLKTYLWPYVADEHILYVLLDEIMMSASLRCTSPDIMDSKVVEFICEQI